MRVFIIDKCYEENKVVISLQKKEKEKYNKEKYSTNLRQNYIMP